MRAREHRQLTTHKARWGLRLAAFLGAIGEILPVSVGYWLCDRCGDLIYAFTPKYRRNVRSNLSHVTGLDDSASEVHRLARRVFRQSARNFFDLMRMSRLSDAELRASIIGSAGSWERLDRVRKAGHGAIIVSAHLGAFDFTGHAIFTNGYPITPLTTRTVPEPVYQIVNHLRQTHGVVIEEANAPGIRRIIAAVRRGEFAGLLADRDFFQNGIPVEFFGAMTTLPAGPARIARDNGAPIVIVFTKRLRSGYQLHVDEPFDVERSENPERDISRALVRVVQAFERQIRDSPDQWAMFQRVWPDPATEPERVAAHLESDAERTAVALRQSPSGGALSATLDSRPESSPASEP
jgi:phosphatidylinositol dimannoside acyltransferase